mmetsp:Transcript_24238/g.26926  ORF Transcript_24238/g.26926 Transcript_24238/m.26926 type:complete len:211 (+) Transcript_24238:55-687(+)
MYKLNRHSIEYLINATSSVCHANDENNCSVDDIQFSQTTPRQCEQLTFQFVYRETSKRIFGRTKSPILHALCMAVMYNMGVVEERRGFFRVMDHKMFMFAILLLTGSKQSRAKKEYHRYKAMTRWIKIHSNRKQHRQWTFSLRHDKLESWGKAYKAIVRTLLHSENAPLLGYRVNNQEYHFASPQSLGAQCIQTLVRNFSRTSGSQPACA